MEKIKIIIKSDSPVAIAFKKHMARKDAFRAAVKKGGIKEFMSTSKIKFDCPVSINL